MTNRNLKWFKRGLDSALSVGRSIIPPAVNFLVAYLVINLTGQSSWGKFVDILIFTSLSSMFISFGIKQYVLRQASLQPSEMSSLIKSGILVRLILIVPCILVAIFLFPVQHVAWISIWLIATLISSGIDPIINFNRNYWPAILSELAFGSFLLVYLILTSIDQTQLVVAFSLAAVFRATLLTFFFRKDFATGAAKFDLKLLVIGLPFLAMGFGGMLQSKTDLYLVAFLLGDKDLAVYHVTVNFFIYLQALSAFLTLPLAKNIYRLPKRIVWKMSFRFSLLGILILSIGLPIIYIATNHLYHFGLSINMFLIGGLYILPTFANLPIIYRLIGLKEERAVLYTNLLGAVINLVCSYFLILRFGIIGALIGSAVAKWTVLPIYIFQLNRKSN